MAAGITLGTVLSMGHVDDAMKAIIRAAEAARDSK